jgi:glutamate-1-semialdehyde 2,1-aminomutase
MPAIEMFRMLGSGTEGVMAAIRAARTFTGKRKIIKVGGAYHGWSDQMVYGLHIPGTGAMEAFGIPGGCLKETQEVFPNHLDELRDLLSKNSERGGTAAVIVEPVGPESGTRPVHFDFNQKVRQLCDEFGALLIFDEVVTGFRLGLGGAQGYFNVRPDLTVFANAWQAAILRLAGWGRADVMSTWRPAWNQARNALCWRHPVCQSSELRRRLLRHTGDGTYQRRSQSRPGRRPSEARPAGCYRQI